MKILRKLMRTLGLALGFSLGLGSLCGVAQAQDGAPANEMEHLKLYLQQETAGINGRVEVSIGDIDPRLQLPRVGDVEIPVQPVELAQRGVALLDRHTMAHRVVPGEQLARRAESGRDMIVPKEVVMAHPHLLLALESYERSSDAAVRNSHEEFLVALSRAREESRIFEAVLKQHGWQLPKVN